MDKSYYLETPVCQLEHYASRLRYMYPISLAAISTLPPKQARPQTGRAYVQTCISTSSFPFDPRVSLSLDGCWPAYSTSVHQALKVIQNRTTLHTTINYNALYLYLYHAKTMTMTCLTRSRISTDRNLSSSSNQFLERLKSRDIS